MTGEEHSEDRGSDTRPAIRALTLSLLALAVPVGAAVWFPHDLQHYEALLWLLALVPAFLLAFQRGWQGAATALALGMAVLSVTYAATSTAGHQVPETLFPVVVAFMGITLGLGWFGGELQRTRAAVTGPTRFLDDETKLPTWAYAQRYLEGEFEAARRGRALAVVIFRLSAPAGPKKGAPDPDAIQQLADVLRQNTRKMNISSRMGTGEEYRFVSVLTGGDLEGTSIFAHRILDGFRDRFPRSAYVVSAGIATFRPGIKSVDDLIERADEALNEALQAGGDRVRSLGTVVHSETEGPEGAASATVEVEATPESRTFRALLAGSNDRLAPVAEKLTELELELDTLDDVTAIADALRRPCDLVVVDIDSIDGAEELVAAIRHRSELTQVLLIAEPDSAAKGLVAMNSGAAHCLMRPLADEEIDAAVTTLLERRDHLLRAAIERTHITDELTARQREIQMNLHEAEQQYREVVDRMREVVFEIDEEGRWQFLNPAWERLVGRSLTDSLGTPFTEVFRDDDQDSLEASFRELIEGERDRIDTQVRVENGSGEHLWVAFTAAPSLGSDGNLDGVYGTLVDVTTRRELEEQLRQAQKMEAVGQLAGGIAHDFNNLLMAIRGNVELVLDAAELDADAHADLETVVRETQRATNLTSQLLAFSRQDVPDLHALDLPDTIRSMEDMLCRLMGETIEVVIDVPESPVHVEADEAQIQQVILNLVTNARDAMPAGGRIEVAIDSVQVDRSEVEKWPAAAEPGEFVVLRVADTGIGMDELTQQKVFDPFFTTKPVDRGTGLGLATVFGIVTESRGHVTIESRPGKGSEFRVFLPRASAPDPGEDGRTGKAIHQPGEGDVILVVEDEGAVRTVVRRYLEAGGFRVYEAESAVSALSLAANVGLGNIDLVITDIVMPGSSGPELVEQLREQRPDLPAIYMSGYAQDETEEVRRRTPGAFLKKPFQREDLLTVLAEARGPQSAPAP